MSVMFVAVKTETEILGGIEEKPKVEARVFENEVLAMDCIRKWFSESCAGMCGLCFAKFSECEFTGKVCGECTVVTVGVRRSDGLEVEK